MSSTRSGASCATPEVSKRGRQKKLKVELVEEQEEGEEDEGPSEPTSSLAARRKAALKKFQSYKGRMEILRAELPTEKQRRKLCSDLYENRKGISIGCVSCEKTFSSSMGLTYHLARCSLTEEESKAKDAPESPVVICPPSERRARRLPLPVLSNDFSEEEAEVDEEEEEEKQARKPGRPKTKRAATDGASALAEFHSYKDRMPELREELDKKERRQLLRTIFEEKTEPKVGCCTCPTMFGTVEGLLYHLGRCSLTAKEKAATTPVATVTPSTEPPTRPKRHPSPFFIDDESGEEEAEEEEESKPRRKSNPADPLAVFQSYKGRMPEFRSELTPTERRRLLRLIFAKNTGPKIGCCSCDAEFGTSEGLFYHVGRCSLSNEPLSMATAEPVDWRRPFPVLDPWAPPPTLGPLAPGACLPSLEFLLPLSGLRVAQRLDLVEAGLPCLEQASRFDVQDGDGLRLLYGEETSGCCHRSFCGASRGYVLRLRDGDGAERLRVVGPFGCCDGYCCKASADVFVGETRVGSAQQTCGCCKSRVSLRDDGGEAFGEMVGPCCEKSHIYLCRDSDYAVLGSDGETEIGHVVRLFKGLRTCFGDAVDFDLSFPVDLDAKAKATLLGAAILINFINYE